MNKQKITTKLILIFGIFTLCIMVVAGVITYINQMRIYTDECKENAYHICEYLKTRMEQDEDIEAYQNYFLEHYNDMDIRIDYTDYNTYKSEFNEAFSKYYPDRTLGVDIEIDELNDEVRNAYFTYRHAYWFSVFQTASEKFGVAYIYYVVPADQNEQPEYMVYMIDAFREAREDDKEYLNLGITVPQLRAEHKMLWKAYDTGKNPDGYDTIKNEFGHVYGFYSPLKPKDKVLGVIASEIEISDFNQAILRATILQTSALGAVLIVAMMVLVTIINRQYIKRLESLEVEVGKYADTKDAAIAMDIEKLASNYDEISSLSREVANMIRDIESHMKSLVSMKWQLNSAEFKATRDALTGVRNKRGFDEYIHQLEWQIEEGGARFGIAMIDLNFLKKINDTYGHEKGNISIKKLCEIVCQVFSHSPVFRIGGDEFVVILQGKDYEDVEMLQDAFMIMINRQRLDSELEEWERVSAAFGYASFDPSADDGVASVMHRADKYMYENKKSMKAQRET